MAIRAVEDYYKQICEQYKEMLENLKDFEKEVQDGVVEPERLERLQEQVAPIKQNYERWTYMMFLLHQPNRKSKQHKYKNQNKKLLAQLDNSNSLEAVIEENTEAMKHVGE